MRIQNNTYSSNNLCKMQNIKQTPTFESRGETKYIGEIYFLPDTKDNFEKYMNSHPAVIEFFKKYDGDFVVHIDEDNYGWGSLALRYTHPLHPDIVLPPIKIVSNAHARNSYECLEDIISKTKEVNKSEKAISLSYENWPSGPDDYDHLSFILNSIDRNIQEDIQAHNELQAKYNAKQNNKQSQNKQNWLNRLLKK